MMKDLLTNLQEERLDAFYNDLAERATIIHSELSEVLNDLEENLTLSDDVLESYELEGLDDLFNNEAVAKRTARYLSLVEATSDFALWVKSSLDGICNEITSTPSIGCLPSGLVENLIKSADDLEKDAKFINLDDITSLVDYIVETQSPVVGNIMMIVNTLEKEWDLEDDVSREVVQKMKENLDQYDNSFKGFTTPVLLSLTMLNINLAEGIRKFKCILNSL